ncbi:MAG: hypothetical protein ACM359_15570 [Bacillota bacterium]
MWMEQLEARQLLSGTIMPHALAPSEAVHFAPLAAAAAVPKLPNSYTGSMSWKSGNDSLVLMITKQTPSANGRVLWLSGSLLQVGISESFAVSAKVDLRTRQVTGQTRGIATGTITGTFGPDWSFAYGQFASTQAGRTTKGSFDLSKPKAIPYDLRGTYKGRSEQGDAVTLSLTKQSAAGMLTGTATSGDWRFDVVGLVSSGGTCWLGVQGDGTGSFRGYFNGGHWRTLQGNLILQLGRQRSTLYYTLRRI